MRTNPYDLIGKSLKLQFFLRVGIFATSRGKFFSPVREIFFLRMGVKTGRRRDKLIVCKILYFLIVVALWRIIGEYLSDNSKVIYEIAVMCEKMRKWENGNRVGFSFERGKLIMVSMIRLSFLIIIILCLFQTTLNLSFSVSQLRCFFLCKHSRLLLKLFTFAAKLHKTR